MTIELSLDEAINHYPKLVDELTYICYKYNRERSPDITPDQWGKIFANVDLLEQRYQSGLAKGR